MVILFHELIFSNNNFKSDITWLCRWGLYRYYRSIRVDLGVMGMKMWIYTFLNLNLVKYTDAEKYETVMTLRCSGTKCLLTKLTVFRHEEGERYIFYYADCTIWSNKRAAHPVASSWIGPASRISTYIFFKITKFSAHRFRTWRHSHPSLISLWGFMTFVIVISSARERELYSMCVHLL